MTSKVIISVVAAMFVVGLTLVVLKDKVEVVAASDTYTAVINACEGQKSRSPSRRGRSQWKSNFTYAPVAVSEEGYRAIGRLRTNRALCEGMIGAQATIFVDRNHPTDGRINSFAQFWLFPTMLLFAFGFCLAVFMRKNVAAVGVFFGFFAIAGIAATIEFRIFKESIDPSRLEPVNGTLALQACINLSMQQEGVKAPRELRRLRCKNRGIADLSILSRLVGLEELDLSSNNIAALEPIGSLSKLGNLNLDGNKRLSSLKGIENLNQLTELSVHCAALSDLSALSLLTGLRFVDVSCNQINDLSAFEQLNSLVRVEVGDNPNLSDISVLANKPLLEIVGMYHTSVNDVSPLFGNVKLSRVNIGSSGKVPCAQIHQLRTNLSASAQVRASEECK